MPLDRGMKKRPLTPKEGQEVDKGFGDRHPRCAARRVSACMLAPSGVFMVVLLIVRPVLDPDAVAVLSYVFGEVCKSVLQILYSTDQGLHVRPVILPVSFPFEFHPIDVCVENLPAKAVRVRELPLRFPLVGHLVHPDPVVRSEDAHAGSCGDGRTVVPDEPIPTALGCGPAAAKGPSRFERE